MNRAERIEQLRHDAGFDSLGSFCSASGIRAATISHYCTGKTSRPHGASLKKLGDALGGANPEWIWEGTGPVYLGEPPYRARIRQVLAGAACEHDPAQFDARVNLLPGTMRRALEGEALSYRDAERCSEYTGRPVRWFLEEREPEQRLLNLQAVLQAVAIEGGHPRLMQSMPALESYLLDSPDPDPAVLRAIIRAFV